MWCRMMDGHVPAVRVSPRRQRVFLDVRGPPAGRVKDAEIMLLRHQLVVVQRQQARAQHAILEHNVSVDVATRYKRSSRDGIRWLAERLRDLLPELDDERALRASHMVIILVGALWTRSRPAPAQLAAFQADSSLAFMHPAFAEAFEAAITTFLRGLIAEAADAA
jgi:hypothetical protein